MAGTLRIIMFQAQTYRTGGHSHADFTGHEQIHAGDR